MESGPYQGHSADVSFPHLQLLCMSIACSLLTSAWQFALSSVRRGYFDRPRLYKNVSLSSRPSVVLSGEFLHHPHSFSFPSLPRVEVAVTAAREEEKTCISRPIKPRFTWLHLSKSPTLSDLHDTPRGLSVCGPPLRKTSNLLYKRHPPERAHCCKGNHPPSPALFALLASVWPLDGALERKRSLRPFTFFERSWTFWKIHLVLESHDIPTAVQPLTALSNLPVSFSVSPLLLDRSPRLHHKPR